jgi:hypothetical protein
MSTESADPRGADQGKPQKTARVGQPGEERRTSQENAGSTQGGGTRNADNSIERASEDRGVGREQRSDRRKDQVAKEDGITGDDIEAGNDSGGG